MTVDEYIENLGEDKKSIVLTLRELILTAAPAVKENIKWNSLTFAKNKDFCSIVVHRSHINLQIFQGARIASSIMLEGTGKEMRHLKIHAASDIKKSAIKKILKQAISIDQGAM